MVPRIRTRGNPELSPGSEGALKSVFPGNSELAARMRALDWSRTPLGPPSRWPQNLRVALGICLTSRFAMHLWWGPELILFYNDAYVSFLGPGKHPAVLGRPAREAWEEIWPTIRPMINRVVTTGEASWSEDMPMFFDRALAKEEVYVTFSFSPVLGESGAVDGLFCACTETTAKIVGNRRLETLRKLGIRAVEARTVDAACVACAEVLAKNPYDIPFAAIYVVEEPGGQATLRASSGMEQDTFPLPDSFGRTEPEISPWPLSAVLREGRPCDVDLRAMRIHCGPWPEATQQAVVLPILGASHETTGVMIIGVGPRSVLDEQCRTFFELVTGHVGTAIADARAYAAERRRAEALAELDQAKTAFFSNISHEFRTPLTLMLAPIEAAIEGLSPSSRSRVADHLDTVQRNVHRLLKLVNTLLDFSRIEAGKQDARFEPTDLVPFTSGLAEMFRSTIERAGLRYRVQCEPIARSIHVDRAMWEKIVLNLLSNAFKFTFEGEIALSLRERKGQVELVVTDTGIGVAAQDIPRLFERFHRVAGARARTYEGSGIGLALVRELVHLHGGQISATSEPGKGTSFVVTIPVGKAHLPADHLGAARPNGEISRQAPVFVSEARRWLVGNEARLSLSPAGTAKTAPVAPDESAGVRVLVVDDNADMREYVARLLGARWAVDAVEDGGAALAALGQRRYGLVLADVMMPQMDGFMLLQHIRADPELKHIPVILLSARAGEECRIEGLQSGADDYLIKPFSARELVARVETQLKSAARRSAVEANRAKDEFLALLGHELRNPLTPILATLELMRVDGARKFAREREVLGRNARHLARMVDDLLDLARIAHGKIGLSKKRIQVAELVSRAIELAAPLLEEQRHHLEVEVPGGLIVNVDPGRMVQVITNLLTNAAKYTNPGGQILIRAGADDSEVWLTVQDDGVGISDELLPHVFDRFRQASQRLDRAKGGLGLGLSIVKDLVALHEGTVHAESGGQGQGSVFRIRLPRAEGPPGARTPSPIVEARPVASTARRFLVVDDNRDIADVLAQVLRGRGHAVDVAYEGTRALELARACKPDVAVLDIGLPGMNGYELAQRMRKTKGLERLMLVAVTGYSERSDRIRAKRCGFEHHIAKPFQMEHLMTVLEGPTDRGASFSRRPRPC